MSDKIGGWPESDLFNSKCCQIHDAPTTSSCDKRSLVIVDVCDFGNVGVHLTLMEQVEQANRAYNRQLVAEMPDKQQHAAAPEPMVPAVADEPLEFVLQSDYKASFPHYRDIQCNRSRFRMRNADTDYRERALRQFGSLGKGYRS